MVEVENGHPRQSRRPAGWAALLLALACSGAHAFPALQDEADYSQEEYAEFQSATQESNPAQRETRMANFLKSSSSNMLRSHVLNVYIQALADYRKQQNHQAVARGSEKFLQLGASFTAGLDADLQKAGKKFYQGKSYDIFLGLATEAYQKMGNQAKFVEFAQQLYAQMPNADTAYSVAKIYNDIGNAPKFVEWANKTLRHDPDNLPMLMELVRVYATQNNLPEASRYARQALKAVETPGKGSGEWDKQRALCYRVLGEEAFVRSQFQQAMAQFQNSLKYDKHNDHAYFRLGFCYWQLSQGEPAMAAFAKAYVLNGPTSKQARTQLEALYKPTHNNTLTGIERLYERAREELRSP
ncbi:MAG: tetratricopeptide repeat protein [Acidobacteria bacterium]|nr:tetratricopeptide repeat protein [Acidobacteriota bacterium]